MSSHRRRRSTSRSVRANKIRTIVAAAFSAACASAFADASTNVTTPAADTQSAAPAYPQKSGSWVFVPVPVSNPTFGNGLQLGAIYLHAPSADGPPATSGVGGMVTDDGSKLIAAFHDQSFMSDRFRLTAILGGGHLAAKFYGIGSNSIFANNPIDYSFYGEVLALEGAMRVVPESNWFVGLNLQQTSARIEFDASQVAEPLPDVSAKFRIIGVGPEAHYDSRDDKTYPTTGENVSLRWFDYQSSWGNQAGFNKTDVDARLYRSFTSQIVGAVRGRFQAASDGTPFFALPSMGLRGVSSDRYRDARVVSASAEVRYAVLPRWGLLGFVDAGRAAASVSDLGSAHTVASYGGGARWQASADRRLYLAVVAAFSPGANTLFIQVGEAF